MNERSTSHSLIDKEYEYERQHQSYPSHIKAHTYLFLQAHLSDKVPSFHILKLQGIHLMLDLQE